jgi:hypothetical protein
MTSTAPSLMQLFTVIEQYAQLPPSRSQPMVDLVIGSEPHSNNNMKYYLRQLTFGAMIPLGEYPSITEIHIPMMGAREDALQDFMEKKGFTSDIQILYGVVPPTVRVLRLRRPTTPDPVILDNEMKGYLKTLKSLSLPASWLYTAIVVPSVQEALTRVTTHNRYHSGLGQAEFIVTQQATSLKEVIALAHKILPTPKSGTSFYMFKNQDDPENVYKINFKVYLNNYSLERSSAEVSEMVSKLQAFPEFHSAPTEHRIEILDHRVATLR